jgi:NitT/TauT family transport system substrate-binding protein
MENETTFTKAQRMLTGIAIIAVIGVSVGGCQKQPVEKVTIALAVEAINALPIIAQEQDFFSQERLDVRINEYPSGKRALQGMLKGEGDLATAAGIPIMFNTFERDDFSIVTGVGAVDDIFRIVARKDRGIQQPEDLQGKHLATQEGSGMHFFLASFLVFNNISIQNVEISFRNVEDLPEALLEEGVDAASLREPFISEAKVLLGEDNVIVFSEPQAFTDVFYIVAFDSFIQDKPEVLERVVRALLRAEQFAKTQPKQAITIIANKLGVDESSIEVLWPQLSLEVSLQQSYLVEIESEARWAIKNQLTDKTEVPNYLDYIYMDTLEEVKPEAIGIIR